MKFREGLDLKLQPYTEELNSANIEYIKNSRNALGLSIIYDNINNKNFLNYEELFREYPIYIQNSERGKYIAEKILTFKNTSIGNYTPDFTLPNVNGVNISLSSLRGQYVLLDFWASWCGPCRKDNPYLVSAYNKYKDSGFTVLGVSLDDDNSKEAWLKAIEQDRLGDWNNVCEFKGMETETAKLYMVNSVPQNFLLDKEGKIVASNLRGEALEAKLAELLD